MFCQRVKAVQQFIVTNCGKFLLIIVTNCGKAQLIVERLPY